MPQFDQIWSFPSQVFWLVVCFVALFFVLQRVVIPRVSEVRESRRERVDTDLEKASELKAEADAALADYEKTIADARSEATAALRSASEEAADKAARERDALAARLGEEIDAAERSIVAEKQRALAEVEAIASDIAQAAAERLLGASVDDGTARKAVAEARREAP